jgi:hypothetical protein
MILVNAATRRMCETMVQCHAGVGRQGKAAQENGQMATKSTSPGHYNAQMLHEQIEKVSATLPEDVRRRVMRWVDDAGEVAGAMLMLDILHHLRIRDNKDLTETAREVVNKHTRD